MQTNSNALPIKLIGDYNCPPIWWDEGSNEEGPVDLATLPIPLDLAERINRWSLSYDSENFDAFAWLEFEREGLSLWSQLYGLLSSQYRVRYFCEPLSRYIGTPQEMVQASNEVHLKYLQTQTVKIPGNEHVIV